MDEARTSDDRPPDHKELIRVPHRIYRTRIEGVGHQPPVEDGRKQVVRLILLVSFMVVMMGFRFMVVLHLQSLPVPLHAVLLLHKCSSRNSAKIERLRT